MNYLTIDDVFKLIGQFGWSQKLYYLGINVLNVFLAFHMLLTVFTGRYIDRCWEDCHLVLLQGTQVLALGAGVQCYSM